MWILYLCALYMHCCFWVFNTVIVTNGVYIFPWLNSGLTVMSFYSLVSSTSSRVSTFLGNSGLYWTIFAQNRDTAMPVEGNSDLQTLISVLMPIRRRCPTLSNTVFWQSRMVPLVAYPGHTLQMRMLLLGWPVMVHDMHTKKKELAASLHFVAFSSQTTT